MARGSIRVKRQDINKKRNEYLRSMCNPYFWRTYDRQEIDLVEENAGHIDGYEIKLGNKNISAPSGWRNYQNASFSVINKGNYLDFITR